MKTFVRVMALVLACLCCLMVVVSCKEKTTTTTTKKGGGNTVAGDNSNEEYTWDEKTGKFVDKWGKEKDDLPEDLNFRDNNGRPTVINVLHWADVEKPDFSTDEDSDDERLSAIYYRNRAIQNRLGVKLEFDSVNGNYQNQKNFLNHVEAAQEAGTHDFDIIATYSIGAGLLATKGLLVDLNRIEQSYLTIDTPGKPREEKKPWWPQYLSENMAMGNKLFLLSGDIALTVIDEMHCIYFNKELVNIRFEEEANEAGVEDGSRLLYSYVRGGTWTIDKLLEMATGYYVDNNGTGAADYGDRFGLCSISYCAVALYGSANFRMLQADPQNVLTISPDVRSNRLAIMANKVGRFMTSNDYYRGADGGFYVDAFANGDALFILHYLESAEDHLINNDRVEEYGLVPGPKYNAEQKNYYTVVGNAFSVFSIFKDYAPHGTAQETLSMLSAVLECWASESYRKCTPVLFELNMQLKYAQTQDETDMCEYIRAGIMFDLGRIMENALGGYLIDSAFIQVCEAGSDWTSRLEQIYKPAENGLKLFLQDLSVDFNT